MNLLSWMVALGLLITLLVQGIELHRATVCRQEAYLKSTELITKTLLHKPKSRERDWHLSCRLHLLRNGQEVFWQRLPDLTSHEFSLTLKGSL